MQIQVYTQRFKVESLQRILRTSIIFLAASLPMIYSMVARFFTMFFLIEVFILGVWLFTVSRKKDAKLWYQTKSIDFEKLQKPLKITWICVLAVVLVFWGFAAFTVRDPLSSVYGFFVVFGNFLAPLLFAVLPVYLWQIIKAKDGCTEPLDEDYRAVKQKTKNYIIIIMMTVVFVLSYLSLYYMTPAINQTAPQYWSYQQRVKTHSIKNVYEFKTSSDGAQTLASLFAALPDSDTLLEVSAGSGKAYVKYSEPADGVQKTVVYNATAAFALTDGLEEITFSFDSGEVTITRENAVSACENFEQILYTGVWYGEITSVVADDALTDAYFKKIIE